MLNTTTLRKEAAIAETHAMGARQNMLQQNEAFHGWLRNFDQDLNRGYNADILLEDLKQVHAALSILIEATHNCDAEERVVHAIKAALEESAKADR